MINDSKMLNLIMKNAEMGCIGINNVLDHTSDNNLKTALNTQFTEYNKIYRNAAELSRESGNKKLEGVGTIAKASSSVMASVKTMGCNSDSSSKIAELMINGSTMGVTKVIKNMNEYDGSNNKITGLADKLLKTEQRNIEEMKKFL